MKKLLILALFIVGCAPKSYIGMTEKDFLEKKPYLIKYSVKNSYLSDAVMEVVAPENNEELPYFYTENIPHFKIITWFTFGRVNGYYYFFDPETDTLSYIKYGNAEAFKNNDLTY